MGASPHPAPCPAASTGYSSHISVRHIIGIFGELKIHVIESMYAAAVHVDDLGSACLNGIAATSEPAAIRDEFAGLLAPV